MKFWCRREAERQLLLCVLFFLLFLLLKNWYALQWRQWCSPVDSISIIEVDEPNEEQNIVTKFLGTFNNRPYFSIMSLVFLSSVMSIAFPTALWCKAQLDSFFRSLEVLCQKLPNYSSRLGDLFSYGVKLQFQSCHQLLWHNGSLKCIT